MQATLTCFRHASQRHTRPKDGEIICNKKFRFCFFENNSAQLEAESQEFGDLVQGNYLDTYRLVNSLTHCLVFVLSYRNLTYKNVMGKMWIATFCSQAELVVKADDDS